MTRYGILQPESFVFTDVTDALAFMENPPFAGIVIKADGLCAGKGVILPNTREEARETIRDMMSGNLFGEAGKTIVIQEKLSGPEVSVMAFTDGKTVIP